MIRTADIGRVDLASHLSVADRIKDIIVRGGETISSSQHSRTGDSSVTTHTVGALRPLLFRVKPCVPSKRMTSPL